MLINKENINTIVNNTDNLPGKVFTFTVQFLIIVSLVTFSIDTLPNLTLETKNILYIVEVFTVAVFTVEYILRFSIAENKLKFIFSFYGVVDLIAILPFYVASGFDLRAIRIFRLLRLVRILKLFKYS